MDECLRGFAASLISEEDIKTGICADCWTDEDEDENDGDELTNT